jgi:hypothetical protein
MMRRAPVPLAVLVCSLLVAVPLAGAAKTKNFFGVIAQTPLGEGDTQADINRLREANPATVRFIILWNDVQPTKGPCKPTGTYSPGTGSGANNCNWGSVDQNVKAAAAAGVRPWPYVFGTPGWTRSSRKGKRSKPWVPPVYSKGDRKAWQNFVKAAVNRYGRGGVFWKEQGYNPKLFADDWQIWNEPSSPAYFAPRPDARKYAQLLKLSAKAVRQADRKADVVTAGVFGTPRRRGGGIDMPDWYRKLYRIKGIEKAFDLIAMHPYAKNMRGISYQIKTLRRVMKQAGDARTKLWISEIGWASGGPKGHTLAGTPKSQARRLKQAFRLIKRNRNRWKIAGVNWFSWRDAPEGQSSCASCPFAGLLKHHSEGGEAKPAFNAFKKFT